MSRSKSGDEPSRGWVSLIGAGPGDPKLITLLGLERLRGCEAVVYDRLIPHSLLDEAPLSAERIDVGKDPGQPKIPQEEINRILVEKASQGLRVVRLKGGDSLIFARVGEEMSALAEAGIRFEIIPGVTAASAAAAEAIIPLTHRGVSSSITLVTGHEDPDKESSQIPWAHLVGVGTVAFYMVGGRTQSIAKRLIEAGLSGATPATIVSEATLPNRKIVRSTVSELSIAGEDDLPGHPAVLFVGETVGLAPEAEPSSALQGKTIVATHPAESDDLFLGALKAMGATVLHCPSIQIVPPDDLAPLAEKVAALKDYDWVLFTSKNAVEAVANILKAKGWDARRFGDCKIAVVGKATGERLARLGLIPDLIPEEFSAEALAVALEKSGEVPGKRFLFPCSEIARETLILTLQKLGGSVDRVVAYRTITSTEVWLDRDFLSRTTPDAVLFASSSAVTGFKERLGSPDAKRIFAETLCLSIGKKTTATLEEIGAKRIVEAEISDFAGLVRLVMSQLAS